VRATSGSKEWTSIALMGGFAEVEADEVTILVNGAELGSSIDRTEAEKAYEEAQAKSNTVSGDDRKAAMQASNALKKARARLQASDGSF
jgi:F-type H+-transporting ATPase subunit epsilon